MKRIHAFLLTLTLSLSVFGQASKQVLSVGTIADLHARRPQTNEVVSVRHGSASNLWVEPRLFVHDPAGTATPDNVFDVTNRAASGRYTATDKGSRIFDVRWFGAIPGDGQDDTAALQAAAAALQSAGGGTLRAGGGTFNVSAPPGSIVFFLTGLTDVKIEADDAIFTESDYVDSTWTSITLTNLGTVASATFASAHGFSPGSPFLIKDSTDVAFDGYWTVTHVDSPTKIRFNITAYNVPAGPAIAIAHVSDTSHVLFRLNSCTNVNLGKIVFRGHALPVENQFRLGWRVVEAFRGTKHVRGEIDCEGAAYGFYSGEYNVQSISGCSDLRVSVIAKSVGYPVQATGLDDSTFSVIADTVHRGGYFGGVRRSSANIWAKDWDIVGALLSHQPDPSDSRGCEDFTLRVWDTGTTKPQKLLAYGGYRHMASVAGYANTNAVKHKNLDIRVYGKNIPRGVGLIVQTYGTNHWVDGLKFGGDIDQSGLNATNTGWPMFIYDTDPTTAGHYRDLVFDDFKWRSTTNSGAYPGYIRLAQAENDVEFNRYSTDIYTSQALPDGIHTVTVPRFPDWDHGSFEAAQAQRVHGGIKLASTKTIAPMSASLGTNDFTVQWVGTIPSGNSGLFSITTGTNATAGSFGASITNGHLIVRAYGTSETNWAGVTATNWASGLRGKVASLGIVKTDAGLELWTDGHTTAAQDTTSGTAPAWTDALSGTNAYIGIDDSASSYFGTVHRFAVWNYDRSGDFPALAVGWDAGSGASGISAYTVNTVTANGGFETLGGGGADVFASWIESSDGSSSITVSTNSVEGTNSLAMTVDESASFASVASSETMIPGVTYEITFWARVPGGTSGQIALVGPAVGDYPIAISGTWARYSVTLPWNATTFSIKRWSLTGQTAEIDAVTVRRSGAICDYDWTESPADRTTGVFSSPLGGAATRVLSRGAGISADRGDNSASLEAGQDAPVQVWASALTGARTVTVQTNHAKRGDVFRVVRTGAGAGTLTVAAPVSRAVATDEWLDLAFDGSAWGAVAYGKVAGAYGSGGGTNSWKIEVNTTEVTEPDLTDTATIGWSVVGPAVSGAVKTGSLGTNNLTAGAYSALVDLANHTGTLAGSQVGSGINDDNVSFDDADNLWTATAVGPALEELNDSINAGVPNGTGAKLHWSQLLGVPAGFADGTDDGSGGGGNADTNAPNTWAQPQTFSGGIDASGATNDLGVVHATALELDTPLDPTLGGTGGTNAATAQVALGLQPDVDVQAYRLQLLQAAHALTADGHMLYRDASGVTNLTSTAAGRALLEAVSHAAQWAALLSSATTTGVYSASDWDGITDRLVTLDQFRDVKEALPGGSNAITQVTPPLHLTNGVLSIDTTGLGGGSGGGVTWLANESLASYVGLNTSSNWPLASWTISSNDVPTATGKYLFGHVAGVVSNASGSTISANYDVTVNGVRVFRDLYQPSTATSRGKPFIANFMLVRESSTTASFYQLGVGGLAQNPDTGFGGDVNSTLQGFHAIATNITVSWSSNITLAMGFECSTVLGSPTNAMAGLTKVAASLLKYTESAGGGTGVAADGTTITNINGTLEFTNAVAAGQSYPALRDGSVSTNRWDATAHAWVSGKQDGDSDLADLAGAGSTGANAFVRADSPTVTGTWHFDSFTANSLSVLSNLYAVTVAYGVGWNGSSNVPTRDAVYDEMELRAPKASPALTGTPTVNGTNLMAEVNGKQPFDADLTPLASNDGAALTNLNATTAFGSGTIPDARLDADVADLADGSLTGSKVGTGIDAANISTGLLPTNRLDANTAQLAVAGSTGSGTFKRTRTGVPREIWIPASAMNPGSDAPTPATNAWNTTTDGQRWEGWDFSATSTNSVYFLLALPTAWDAGAVKAKVVWKQVVAAATATNSWQIGGGSLTDGETGGNTLGTMVEVLDVGANDTNVVSISAASGAITIGGTPSAGHLTWFTVRRHPGDTDDNYAELSRLIGLHLQYTETSTEPSAW